MASQDCNQSKAQWSDHTKPALRAGAAAAVLGACFGMTRGIMLASHPRIHALASALQWSCFASTYTFSRGCIASNWGGTDMSPGRKVAASAVAGGFAGGATGVLDGPRLILPRMVVLGVAAAAGQGVVNMVEGFEVKLAPEGGWLASKYSPLTPISEEDYMKRLEATLLSVDAEIAILDDKINAARHRMQDKASEKPGNIVTSK